MPSAREIKLLLVLTMSITFAVLIIRFAKTDEPDYRPLLSDMRLLDAVKVADIFDRSGIDYRADLQNQMLYVNKEHSVQARIELAKIGIVIDYPKFIVTADLQDAYNAMSQQFAEEAKNSPYYQQNWFYKVMKLLLATVLVIVLILAGVRPALAAIILTDDEQN
jgi:flagellar biosynthesis/type III secretory pathway M-ring protein FliF/YscJ